MILITRVEVEYVPDTPNKQVTFIPKVGLPSIAESLNMADKKITTEVVRGQVYKTFLNQQLLIESSGELAYQLGIPESEVRTELQNGYFRQEIDLAMSKQVQNVLELPFQELENLKEDNDFLKRKTDSLSSTLDKTLNKLAKFKTANFLERLMYLFTGKMT